MATYKKNIKNSIQRPIPGRQADMTQNLAGGYTFKANDWTALDRWLLTGSMSNMFYQNADKATNDNLEILTGLIEKDPRKVAERVLYASNKGINNHTPILALIYISNGQNKEAKQAFTSIFSSIIRTMSHFHEFNSYLEDIRGRGRIIKDAGRNLLSSWAETGELEYQGLKYQNREGFTVRDELRLYKPKPRNDKESYLYRYFAGKDNFVLDEQWTYRKIEAYEILKRGKLDEKLVIRLIEQNDLTHEMIPANIERTKNIWQALFKKMPVGATIRNLGNLTNKCLFPSYENVSILEKRLESSNIARARLHPLTIASAMHVYTHGGKLGKGSLTWTPDEQVSNMLAKAATESFDILEPTNKKYAHCIDVSSSMWGGSVGNLWLWPAQVAAIMAYATFKAETVDGSHNTFVGGFSENFTILTDRFNERTNPSRVINGHVFRDIRFGGTDASSAYKYCRINKIEADVFVFWTDGESWLGNHPAEELKRYREALGINAKAIYCTLTPYGDFTTLVDPKDKLSYDIAGFSSESPKLVQMIGSGIL